MSEENQWEPWDPFASANETAPKQRLELERAADWQAYLAAGVGSPEYFDNPAWKKGRERQHEAREDAERERSR